MSSWGERWSYGGTLYDERLASMQLRDTESGLDPTLFRMYESRLYRWLSPDPVAGDIFNPQSLNRYAYVLNNPCNLVDPLGLCPPGTHKVNLANAVEAARDLGAGYGGPWVQYDKKTGEIISMDCTGLVGWLIAQNVPGYNIRSTTRANISGGKPPFYADPNGPQVGDIALITASGHNPYGHVVVITGTDPLSAFGSQSSTGPAYLNPQSSSWQVSFYPPGMYPPQYYEVCVPDKQSKKGGGGAKSGTEGRWIWFGTIYRYEDSEGTVVGVYIAGQWIWWHAPRYRRVD